MATDEPKPISLVGRRLSSIRNARRLTAEELASLIPDGQVTKTVITNVESGRKRDLTVTEMALIANALDISPVFLLVDPRHPWDKVGIDGIDKTNIEYARHADTFNNPVSRPFEDGPAPIERALLSGLDVVAEIEMIRSIIAGGSYGADFAMELPSGLHKKISPWSIEDHPGHTIQIIVPQLASAVRSVERALRRYPDLAAPSVLERFELISQTLDDLKRDFPELDYSPGKVWQVIDVTPSDQEADGTSTHAAE